MKSTFSQIVVFTPFLIALLAPAGNALAQDTDPEVQNFQAKYNQLGNFVDKLLARASGYTSAAAKALQAKTAATAAATAATKAVTAANSDMAKKLALRDKASAAIVKAQSDLDKANKAIVDAQAKVEAAQVAVDQATSDSSVANVALATASSALSGATNDAKSAADALSKVALPVTNAKKALDAATSANTRAQASLKSANDANTKAQAAAKASPGNAKLAAAAKTAAATAATAEKSANAARTTLTNATSDYNAKLNDSAYKQALANSTARSAALLALKTAADTAAKNAKTFQTKLDAAKKTLASAISTRDTGAKKLQAAVDAATAALSAAQAGLATAESNLAVAVDVLNQAKDSLATVVSAGADAIARYDSFKSSAAQALEDSKKAIAVLADQKKALDAALAAAATKLAGAFSDSGTNVNGLTFKQEVWEALPRTMGSASAEGANWIKITDNSYDQVQCRYGIQVEAFGKEWEPAEAQAGKKARIWRFMVKPDFPNGSYYLSCRAIKGDSAIYSDTLEFITREELTGIDWSKKRCDFEVSGKSDKTYFAAAAKFLRAKGTVQLARLMPDPENLKAVETMDNGLPESLLKPFEDANENYQRGYELTKMWRSQYMRGFNPVSQPYFGTFGKAQFLGASPSKRISVSQDGKFLLVRRGWYSDATGCNLPGVEGIAKYAGKTGKDPFKFLRKKFLAPIFFEGVSGALFPLNKTAPTGGAKNIYNTNVKVGSVFVMNAKGQGVLMNEKGEVQRTFVNGPRYLRRLFRHHGLEGNVRELRFNINN